MKTLFQLGFPAQRRFWVGQSTGTVTAGGLDYALGLYQQIQAWLAKTPNPATWLGPGDYAAFQAAKAKADSMYADASSFGETLDTGGTLSDAENTEANQFYDAATVAWGYIAQHPTPQMQAPAAAPAPSSASTTQAITNAAGQIVKAFGPQTPTPTAVKPVVPAPAPAASNLTTPLLIGGGALALILVVSLAKG
jgi:hypothetical protein